MPNDSLSKLLNKIAGLPGFESYAPLSPTTKTACGETPLHVAAVWGDLAAIKLLVDAGVDLDARGDEGYTPLHEAAEQGHPEAVALLIELGARIDLKDDHGATACDIAKSLGNDSVVSVFDSLNIR